MAKKTGIYPVVDGESERTKPQVFYLCDGKAADCRKTGCYYNQSAKHRNCKHTSHIEHAVNFKENGSGSFWEEE